jgi:hypothetical protein
MKLEFNLSAHSGIIAASLAANAVLFAWRNPTTFANGDANTRGQRLKQLFIKCRTVTGYTAAQEISLGAYEVSVFGVTGVDYTGGTDLSNPASNPAIRALGPDLGPRPAQETVLQSGNVRIASTAGLSHVGSPTIATHPFAWDSSFELAAAATVHEGAFDVVWTPSMEASDHKKGLMLYPGKGFVIRNPIALGAGGTVRLFVEAFWEEA